MASDVAEYIRKCDVCQQHKEPSPAQRQRAPTLQKPMASEPFQVINIDSCVVRSRNIMIFICQFSGYVELELINGPVNGRKLSEAFIKCIICKHSTPLWVIMDNVSYNVGGLFPETLKKLGVKAGPVCQYRPEANGKAERAVSNLKRNLKTLAHNNPTDWQKLIPLAAFANNVTWSKTTKESPFMITYGREPTLPGPVNTALHYIKNKDDSKQEPDLYAQGVEQRVLKVFENTTNKLKGIQEGYTHPDLLEQRFQIGEEVMMRKGQRTGTDNLQPMWLGPYTVKKVISPVVYHLCEPEKPGKTIRAHVSRLKKRH